MSRKLRKVLTAVITVLTLLGTARATLATGLDPQAGEGIGRYVSYADLNLDRREDAATLYARIERAARSVCQSELGLFARPDFVLRACARHAIERAVVSVNHPNLLAVHDARTSGESWLLAAG